MVKNLITGVAQRADSAERMAVLKKNHPEWDQARPEPVSHRRSRPRNPPKSGPDEAPEAEARDEGAAAGADETADDNENG